MSKAFLVVASRSQCHHISHDLLHLMRIDAWTKELAVLLSVLILVGCWGWLIASRMLWRPIAIWLLWNSTPHSASAAEHTMCLSVLHSMRIRALYGVLLWLRACGLEVQ
eukprot:1808819-Ditylum_brightwellii.AAC.1